MSAIHNYCPATAAAGPNAAIFLSGSGSNAERILEKWQAAGRAGLKIEALVTDRPQTSRALELGQNFGVPVVAHDIREFYAARGLKRISIATPEGRTVRAAWTEELRRRLAAHAVDFAIFAGFVPLTNITADFPCLNVHPGDLTYEKNGARYLVGLHTIPIERAILEGLDHLRTSVIIAEPYEGRGENMDAGPILGISPKVPLDLGGRTLAELREIAARRPDQRPPKGYGDELEAIAKDNQDTLKEGGDWVVFPRVVFDFAAGNFGHDDRGGLYYRGETDWQPVKTVEFGPTDTPARLCPA